MMNETIKVNKRKLELLAALAWDAWATLEPNREKHLVIDLACALEDLGYPTKPKRHRQDQQTLSEMYDDFMSTRLP